MNEPEFYKVQYSRKLYGSNERVIRSAIVTARDYDFMLNDNPESRFGYIVLSSVPATREDWRKQYDDNS